jgi:hypothetical protein
MPELDFGDSRRMRRPGLALISGGLLSLLFLFPLGSYGSSSNDTWSGKWARAEVPGKFLFMSQSGLTMAGHYDWNDASGTLSCKVSGATCSGAFNESQFRGTFTLTLKGTKFTGSYSATNKDTGSQFPGPFNGTCIAGPCLQNSAKATTTSTTTSVGGSGAGSPRKWRWTESYTEQTLKKNLRIPCKYIRRNLGACNVAAAQAVVDQFNHAGDGCYTQPPDQQLKCLQFMISRRPPEPVDHIAHGYPLNGVPDCVGSGTGIRFALLRCKISVLDHDVGQRPRLAVGRIAITPTGRTTFRWQII